MKCPPSTPPFTPSLQALPPLDLEHEMSYFEFDDDDDNSPRARIAKVFRRRGSSNTSGEMSEKEPNSSFSDRPKRKFRKRVSDANQTLKGVFGIKK